VNRTTIACPPDWFNLEYYEGTKLWDDEMLFWQINERRAALIEVSKPNFDPNSIVADTIEQNFVPGPIFYIFNSVPDKSKLLHAGMSRFGEHKGGHHELLIRQMSVSDIQEIGGAVAHADQSMSLDKALESSGSLGKHTYLKINPRSRKKELIEEFEVWLDRFKASHGDPDGTNTTKQKIKEKLFELNIIPYLDLCIWEDLYQLRLEPEKLVRCVLPDSDTGSMEPLIAKLNRRCEDVLSENFLSSLQTSI
jgi:hypothetical protein